MARALIFSGYNERAVIALCRELRAMDEPFSIIAANGRDAIFRTAYRTHVDAIRTVTALDPDDLDRCIRRVQERHPADRYVIAPSSEFLDQHVLTHRAWFAERGCVIPLVNADCYARVTNKWSFRALASTAGLSVPALVDPAAGMFPCVAKPRVNITADGRSLYPVLLHSAEEWARMQPTLGDLRDYYFEELIDGPSYYLLYYLPVDPTAPTFRWSQRNLLQQPGGKSMLLARSDRLHEAPIAQKVSGLLRSIGFHGLAMVELIRRRTSTGGDPRESDYVAIEINPRLWGPMQLVGNSGSHLLRAFIEDTLRGHVRDADPTAGHPASYLWLGGLRPGMVWHDAAPRFPWLSLTRRLTGDVYLRPDTLGLFFNEWARKTP